MATINKITQGDEVDFNVTINEAIVTTATVIKFVCQGENNIVRSFEKSVGSGISKVDTDEYTVTLAEADTLTLAPGIYNIQSLITDAGKSRAINFDPSFFEIEQRLDFS
jgi:hypothetical protein